jgi:hypothetical protein
MKEIERTVNPQEGLGRQKVGACSKGDYTQTIDRSARRSPSKVVMQNIRKRYFEGGLDQAVHRVAEAQATVGV